MMPMVSTATMIARGYCGKIRFWNSFPDEFSQGRGFLRKGHFSGNQAPSSTTPSDSRKAR